MGMTTVRENVMKHVLQQEEKVVLESRDPEWLNLMLEIHTLHESKNQDYSGGDPLSNLFECEKFGVPAWKGILVRMSDKWSRIVNLAKVAEKGGKPNNEPLEDSFKDLGVYALLGYMLLRRKGDEL